MDIPQIFKGVTVLVVDDHRSTRCVARLILKNHGASVVEAEDGEEALKLLEVHRVAAVICDVQMPRLDGLGFVKAMGYPARPEGTPPVYLHSSFPDDFQDEAKALGIALHEKGVMLTELAPRLAALLGIPYSPAI